MLFEFIISVFQTDKFYKFFNGLAPVLIHGLFFWQKNERLNGGMGFGGSTPCAQTRGKEVFIDKHPEDYLREGDFQAMPALFGANKHEGSFVLGG